MDFSSTTTGPLGYSTQKLYLGCGANAALKEEARRKEFESGKKWPPWAEEGKPNAALAGSIFGMLAQLYHAGQNPDAAEEFTWDGVSIEKSHEKTVAEARRIFKWYKENYSVEHWGRFKGFEVFVKIDAKHFGRELTGAIDLLTEDEAGEWINDFKLLGQEKETMRQRFGLNHQTHLYCLARELETGIKPAGVRYLAPYKTTEVKFREYRYEGTTPARFKQLQNFFDTVKMKVANPRPEPSEENCFPYSHPCSLLDEDGICSLLK